MKSIDIMKCSVNTTNNQRNSKRNLEQISKHILHLKALSDENRLSILLFLKDGEKCVCEISDFLNLPQNLISHHLKVLHEQDMLNKRKDGLNVYYSINDKNIKEVIKFIKSLTLNDDEQHKH